MNFPCRSASRPGDTPPSIKAQLLLEIGLDGVGAEVGDFRAETSVVAILVKASFIVSDVVRALFDSFGTPQIVPGGVSMFGLQFICNSLNTFCFFIKC